MTETLNTGHAPAAQRLAQELLEERARQTSTAGWSALHDDHHTQGELVRASVAYAVAGRSVDVTEQQRGALIWPFEAGAYSPRDYRQNLIRAGALLLAELERLERLADGIRFFTVSEDTEVWAATSPETLIQALTEDGIDFEPEAITEISGDDLGFMDEAGNVRLSLRHIYIDRCGDGQKIGAVQLQTIYN